jgi:hypothetical protein
MLSNNKLTGQLPDEIFNLRALSKFIMCFIDEHCRTVSFCSTYSDIHHFFLYLIETLELYTNQLSGTLSAMISNLSFLGKAVRH